MNICASSAPKRAGGPKVSRQLRIILVHTWPRGPQSQGGNAVGGAKSPSPGERRTARRPLPNGERVGIRGMATDSSSPLRGEGFPPRACASEALRKSHGGKGEGVQTCVLLAAAHIRVRLVTVAPQMEGMARRKAQILMARASAKRAAPLGAPVAAI